MSGISSALAAARQAVDALMADDEIACTVTITSDPQDTADDVLNETTGQLEPAGGDATTIYTGPALIAASTTRSEPDEEGGAVAYPAETTCRLPAASPPIKVGYRVHVDEAPNVALVGEDYLVDEVPASAIQVTRRFTIRHTVRGPRR